MTEKPGVVVTGVSGRMGQMLASEVQKSERLALVGALEREGHPWVGRDLGVCMGGTENGVIVTDDAAATASVVTAALATPELASTALGVSVETIPTVAQARARPYPDLCRGP